MERIYRIVHAVPLWYYLTFGIINAALAVVTFDILLPAARTGPGIIYAWFLVELVLEIVFGALCFFCAGARVNKLAAGGTR